MALARLLVQVGLEERLQRVVVRDEDDLRADVKRLSVRDGRGSPRTVLDPTSSPRSFVPVQHPPAQYYRTADGYPISVPARHP